jgi:hypothetical protein
MSSDILFKNFLGSGPKIFQTFLQEMTGISIDMVILVGG